MARAMALREGSVELQQIPSTVAEWMSDESERKAFEAGNEAERSGRRCRRR
jgi:hypothetical protein